MTELTNVTVYILVRTVAHFLGGEMIQSCSILIQSFSGTNVSSETLQKLRYNWDLGYHIVLWLLNYWSSCDVSCHCHFSFSDHIMARCYGIAALDQGATAIAQTGHTSFRGIWYPDSKVWQECARKQRPELAQKAAFKLLTCFWVLYPPSPQAGSGWVTTIVKNNITVQHFFKKTF